jgi:hypothetical protein
VTQAPRPSLRRRVVNSLRAWRDRWHDDGTLDLVPDGFVVKRSTKTVHVRWSEITQIDVATRDMLTFDLFFVVIQMGDREIAIDEFVDGFRQFESSAFERWPQIRERWIAIQSVPPFRPQYETLWKR